VTATVTIDPEGVTIERFDIVDEFLDRLRQLDDAASGWRFLFRGVPDATWSLLPSALREDPPPFETPCRTAKEQYRQEIAALRRFHDAAHFGGLTIPEWRHVQNHVRESIVNRSTVREFVALAQHHGTPTTLLDWTLDPFVAAYFAGSDICRKHGPDKDMAVWWFDPLIPGSNGFNDPWTEVRIPFDVNQNARAQRGVFVEYLRSTNGLDGPPVRESLTQAINRWDEQHKSSLIKAFKRFTLPRARTQQLLNTLRIRHRISASTLFPGYYGAAREERERCQIGDL
jgi:hypothetical protein